MKTLDQLGTAIDQANTKIDALVAQGAGQKFSAVGSIPSTSNCSAISIPEGKLVKLEAVLVTTSGDAGAPARLLYQGRTSSGAISLIQRIPLAALTSDATTTRTGILEIPLWVRGGNLSTTVDGDLYSLNVCVEAASGTSARFVATGVYVQ